MDKFHMEHHSKSGNREQMMHQPHKAVAAGRVLRDQTQTELARLLSNETGTRWSRNMVARLEGGGKVFDVDTLIAVARIQDLPIEFYLFGPATTLPDSTRIPGWDQLRLDDLEPWTVTDLEPDGVSVLAAAA